MNEGGFKWEMATFASTGLNLTFAYFGVANIKLIIFNIFLLLQRCYFYTVAIKHKSVIITEHLSRQISRLKLPYVVMMMVSLKKRQRTF